MQPADHLKCAPVCSLYRYWGEVDHAVGQWHVVSHGVPDHQPGRRGWNWLCQICHQSFGNERSLEMERSENQREKRGNTDRENAGGTQVKTGNVVCSVSIITHSCSVWPARWVPGTWCCLWGWWRCRGRWGPCCEAWRKKGGKPHLALCSSSFLGASLAGSLESSAGRRLTQERIVKKPYYTALDALCNNCYK